MVIEGSACILGAVLLLTLPLRFVGAALLAACVHELCHYAALRLCGIRVWRVRVGPGGAVMDTEPLTPAQELVCSLAGPLGSLLLTRAFPVLPETALCGLVQGLFNLLPVCPLDGGRVLRSAAVLLLGERQGQRLCRWVECGALLSVFMLGTAASLWLRWGILPVFAASVVIIRAISRKTPCKAAKVGVQ